MFRKFILALLMLGLPLALVVLIDRTTPPRAAVPAVEYAVKPDLEGEFVVSKVIDGDTIEVRNERGVTHRVRYIGIDTPEMKYETNTPECLAVEATERNRELVLNKTVTLKRDVSETDSYGRLLRYVTLDGRDVGERLLHDGYATTLTVPPDVARAEVYRQAALQAREAAVGLWGSACLP